MEMTREQLGQFIKEIRKNYGKSRLNFYKNNLPLPQYPYVVRNRKW